MAVPPSGSVWSTRIQFLPVLHNEEWQHTDIHYHIFKNFCHCHVENCVQHFILMRMKSCTQFSTHAPHEMLICKGLALQLHVHGGNQHMSIDFYMLEKILNSQTCKFHLQINHASIIKNSSLHFTAFWNTVVQILGKSRKFQCTKQFAVVLKLKK